MGFIGSFFSSPRRIVQSFFVFLAILAVPITLTLVKQRQDLRQQAAVVSCATLNCGAQGLTCLTDGRGDPYCGKDPWATTQQTGTQTTTTCQTCTGDGACGGQAVCIHGCCTYNGGNNLPCGNTYCNRDTQTCATGSRGSLCIGINECVMGYSCFSPSRCADSHTCVTDCTMGTNCFAPNSCINNACTAPARTAIPTPTNTPIPTPTATPAPTNTPTPTPITDSPQSLICDFDNNGFPSMGDYDVWVAEIRGTSDTLQSDCDHDGQVTIFDYTLWLQAFRNNTTQ